MVPFTSNWSTSPHGASGSTEVSCEWEEDSVLSFLLTCWGDRAMAGLLRHQRTTEFSKTLFHPSAQILFLQGHMHAICTRYIFSSVLFLLMVPACSPWDISACVQLYCSYNIGTFFFLPQPKTKKPLNFHMCQWMQTVSVDGWEGVTTHTGWIQVWAPTWDSCCI